MNKALAVPGLFHRVTNQQYQQLYTSMFCTSVYRPEHYSGRNSKPKQHAPPRFLYRSISLVPSFNFLLCEAENHRRECIIMAWHTTALHENTTLNNRRHPSSACGAAHTQRLTNQLAMRSRGSHWRLALEPPATTQTSTKAGNKKHPENMGWQLQEEEKSQTQECRKTCFGRARESAAPICEHDLKPAPHRAVPSEVLARARFRA